MNSSSLTEALRYREMGLSVIPLNFKSKTPPARFSWKVYQRRLPEISELQSWFGETNHGVAIVCGRVSGNLLVRDFDDSAAWEKFRRRYPDLYDRLPLVKTARGVHLYARADSTEHQELADGELRGDGHYVAAPPSLHPTGIAYQWMRFSDLIPKIERSIFIDFDSRRAQKTNSSVNFNPPYNPSNQLLCDTSMSEGIARTLPPCFGHRNKCLLAFARFLKRKFPCASAEDMEPHVREWHRQALPTISTKAFEISWNEFQAAFPKVLRGGCGPTWAQIQLAAKESQVPEIGLKYGIKFERLFKLLAAMNNLHQGRPFPLACRTAAEFLDIRYRTAARRLHRLVTDGVLVTTNTRRISGELAYEYRCVRGFSECESSRADQGLRELAIERKTA